MSKSLFEMDRNKNELMDINEYKIPYAFIYVNKSELDNHPQYAYINNWLHTHQKVCFGRNITIDSSNSFLDNENYFLILCTRYDYCVNKKLNNRHSLDEVKQLLDVTLGYSVIYLPFNSTQPPGDLSWQNYNKYIISIWNVCKTSTKNKVGKILFSNIILGIKQLCSELKLKQIIPDEVELSHIDLWLCIDIKNPLFEKVANSYISFGFYNPYMSDVDFHQNNLGTTCLCITRPLYKDIISSLEHTNKIFNQVKFMYKDYIHHISNPNHTTRVRCCFDKNTLYELIMLPLMALDGINFLGKGEGDGLIPSTNSETTTHREYSGSFDIIDYKYNETSKIPELHINLSTKNSNTVYLDHINVDYIGEPTSVLISLNSFVYHTHPVHFYIAQNLAIATPSWPDVEVFCKAQFPNLLSATAQNACPCMVSYVITLEGIYSITFHETFISYIKSGKIFNWNFQEIGKLYEYPMDQRRFEWEKDGNIYNSSKKDEHIDRYFRWLNDTVYTQNNGIVKINLVKWGKLFDGSGVFDINTPTLYGNSLVPNSYIGELRPYLPFLSIFSQDPYIINYNLDIQNIYTVESKSLVPALYNSTVGKKGIKHKRKKGSKKKGTLKLSKKPTHAQYNKSKKKIKRSQI